MARRDYALDPYGFESAEQSDDGKGILDYWHILARNRKSILLSSLAGLIIGAAVCVPMKPVYRAETSLEVLSINEDFMNMKQSSPTNANDGSYDTSAEATQAKLLQSVTLAKRVFSKLVPASDRSRSSPRGPATGWRSIFHVAPPSLATGRQALVARAAGTLKVKETPHTSVLEITVDSPDPQLAADYANTLTQEFIAQNAEQRGDSTQNTSAWLRRELDEARDKLRHSEDALQAYAHDSGLIFTDESTNVTTEKLQQVQQELSAASADRIAKQARYELAQNSPPESLADVLNDATLRDMQAKMNDLKRQIADLSTIFNPEYTKIQRLKAERESLQSDFDAERVDILSRIKTDYLEAERKERLMSAAYYAQTREVTGQGEKSIQYNILKRDVDSNRQLYDTMLQQMKQSAIASAMRASNVRVIDAADAPGDPVFPNFKIAAAVGMLAGMFLSSIVVIVRDQLDRTLRQPGDIKLWVDLPELGTIPQAGLVAGLSQEAVYGPLEIDPASPASVSSFLSGNSARQPLELVVHHQKPGIMAEAFRSTLASILFVGGSDENRPRSIMITSTDPGDGKTTVVCNVATAAAEIRMRVLIIDADLRRPRVHHLFKISNQFGLSDLLQLDLDPDSLASVIQPTANPNLDIIPAGAASSAAAHVLYSPNLAALLRHVRDRYDLIVIDTPPMLHMSDARVVARQSDAVVLVARAGRTSRDALIAAKQRMEEDRINVLGTVLNDWDIRRSVGYSYYAHRGSKYAKA